MTFNIRFENATDGENAWSERRALIIKLIQRYEPSVIGTQEGTWSQLVYLRDSLPQYNLYAPHRILDATCQYPTLFFHKDVFGVHEGGEFWLSKTPEVHRSKSWDSAFPRMMSYARVSSVNTDIALWIAVTHLDHIGAEARYQQARILADWVQSRTGPVILMGDFNDDPDSAVHHVLTSPGTGLFDTWRTLGRQEGPNSFTHHQFTGIPQKMRMDWILTSPHFLVADAEIIKDNVEGCYPSDHFPYLVKLEIKPK